MRWRRILVASVAQASHFDYPEYCGKGEGDQAPRPERRGNGLNIEPGHRAKSLLGIAALVVIAASVLLSFNTEQGRLPDMRLPELADIESAVNTASLAGKPAVINFWASWCVACRTDHPLLLDLSRDVPVFGINHLDRRDDALRWLGYYGDPYVKSLFDAEGHVARQLGIDALPVSIVVDGDGMIHYRHLGPLDSATVETIIRPLIGDLRQQR
jgi:cytochrome c biogenesis protein CcmG/thiol:disulfide interchange protein DsbE